MTVSTTITRTSYSGNGVTTAFATTFAFEAGADIKVLLVTTASGAEALQTLGSDYTVSGGAGSTGTVTFATAPASGLTVLLITDPALTQGVNPANGDGLDVDVVIEDPIDRLTRQVQRLSERLDRAVRLKDGDPISALSAVTTAALRAGKTLMFEDTSAADLTVGTPTSSVVVAASETAQGIAELATQTETNTGTDDNRIVTPLKLQTRMAAYVPSIAAGTYGVVGADCKNNSGTPNTQFDLDADVIVLRNTSNHTAVRHAPGAAITNNVSTAGSTANGRDQAGAFSAGSWVHFYWIWDGSTLATLSSATAPPTGPTLPSGYTHWAYAGAVRFNGSSQLVKTRILGATAFYEAAQATSLAATTPATAEGTISLSALVPPNALSARLEAYIGVTATGGGGVNFTVAFRVVTAVTLKTMQVTAVQSATDSANADMELPNVGQQFFYVASNNTNVSTAALTVNVLAYKIPNGGE